MWFDLFRVPASCPRNVFYPLEMEWVKNRLSFHGVGNLRFMNCEKISYES
jgi:hypothetical protein